MNLKELFGKRYKVRREASWEAEKEDGKTKHEWRYQEIPGKYGFIYPYSAEMLGVSLTSKVVANRLIREKGWKIIQDGEDETVFLVPLKDFEDAAQGIVARKRRIVSPEAAQRLSQWHFRPLNSSPARENA